MDQLPISLVSNDLKYTLASVKIKTLEKARQFMHESKLQKDKEKVKKVQKYVNRYDGIKASIFNRLNQQSLDDEPKPMVAKGIRSPQEVIKISIHGPSVIEIFGQKSIGKSAFLMYFCQQFAEKSPDKKVYFINSASGLSFKRFSRLSKKCQHLQYRDTYVLEHVLQVCRSATLDPNLGCIALDSLTNLMMQEQKTMIFVIKLFKIFTQLVSKGVAIYFTNYVQTWFESTDDQKLMNNSPYFSALTSEYIKHKHFLYKEKPGRSTSFQIVRGADIKGEFQIEKDGLGKIEFR